MTRRLILWFFRWNVISNFWFCIRQYNYVDGTLLSVLTLFTQLFTIQGFQYNTYVPLVVCLLPSKTIDADKIALRYVINKVIDLGLNFENQTSIQTQLEKWISREPDTQFGYKLSTLGDSIRIVKTGSFALGTQLGDTS